MTCNQYHIRVSAIKPGGKLAGQRLQMVILMKEADFASPTL